MSASAQLRRRVAPSRLLLVLCTAAAATTLSCTDGAPPLATGPLGPALLELRPFYSTALAPGAPAVRPINRIRLTATSQAGTDTLVSVLRDVSPDASEWTLSLEVPVTGSAVTIVVIMELLHVAGGVETIEWSGRTAPITVTPARTHQAAPVELFRGPPANLTVTAVRIDGAPATLIEGDSVRLTATVTAAGGSPRLFWSALDPVIATVSEDGMVRALRNGRARIVAAAGPRADTATITATQRPVAVLVTAVTGSARSFGDELSYTARVTDARGDSIAGVAIDWSIDDPAIAASAGGGRFIARANGSTAVRATVRGFPSVFGVASLIVAQMPATVAVSPGSALITALGNTATFAATVLDARGNAIAGAGVTWSSSAPAIASVSPGGLVTAHAPGSATITAHGAGGVTGTATITVQQVVATLTVSPGQLGFDALQQTARLTATARDANGHAIQNPAVAWSSSNTAVATVAGSGTAATVTAVGNGTASISVTAGSVSAAAAITVQQVIRSVQTDPAQLAFTALGQTGTLAATARDANGHAVAGATFAWSSSDAAVATVSGSGTAATVTAAGNGTATIRATAGGVTGTATITVQQVVATVAISPADMTLTALGQTGTLAATARDANGHAIAGATFAWSSSNAAVATVSAAGVVQAVGPGSTTVTARSGSAVGSASITVIQVVASIAITPGSVSFTALGQTVQLSATAFDAGGSPIGGVIHAWSSSNPAVATVTSAGLVTALWPGSTTITAAAGGRSASITVTVAVLPDLQVAHISLPSTLTVGQAATVTVRITSRYASAPASIANVIVYHGTTDSALHAQQVPVPSIVANDTMTGQFAFTPEAHWPDSIYARLFLDITDAVAESNELNNTVRFPAQGAVFVARAPTPTVTLQVNPGFRHLAVGQQHQFGYTVTGLGTGVSTTVEWVSLHPVVATVDLNGMVTAVAPGYAPVIVRLTASGITYTDTALVEVQHLRPEGVTKTWVGNSRGSHAWGDPANWFPVGVPAATDVVYVPKDCSAGSCEVPVLSQNVTIHSFVSNHPEPACLACEGVPGLIAALNGRSDLAGSLSAAARPALAATPSAGEVYHNLLLGSYTLTVTGSISGWPVIGAGEGGRIVSAGTGVLQGTLYTDVTISGHVTSARVVWMGNLDVTGRLDMTAGDYLTAINIRIAGAVYTGGDGEHPSYLIAESDIDILNGGRLHQGNAYVRTFRFTVAGGGSYETVLDGGFLDVESDASFGGNSTDGKLNAGLLQVGNKLSTEPTGHAAAFAPGGMHLTIVRPHRAVTISFATPGLGSTGSRVHELLIADSSAVHFASKVIASGTVRSVLGSASGQDIAIHGDLDLEHESRWNVDTTRLAGAGTLKQNASPQLNTNLLISGVYTLAAMALTGNLTAQGATAKVYTGDSQTRVASGNITVRDSAELYLTGGAFLEAGGAFATLATGRLITDDAATNTLRVKGALSLAGAPGSIGAGTFVLDGSASIGDHQFPTGNTVTVRMQPPAEAPLDVGAAGNRLHVLELGGDVLLVRDLELGGTLKISNAKLRADGSAKLLATPGIELSGAHFRNVTLDVRPGQTTAFTASGVHFTDFAPATNRLTVRFGHLHSVAFASTVFAGPFAGSSAILDVYGSGSIAFTGAQPDTASVAALHIRRDAGNASVTWNGNALFPASRPATPRPERPPATGRSRGS
jgi:uncharacterized protein YjdB